MFHFFAAQVSSIPIVDDNDSLLDVYSRRFETCSAVCLITCESFFPTLGIITRSCIHFCSDITSLARDKIYTHINLEETTIHQVSTFILFVLVQLECPTLNLQYRRIASFYTLLFGKLLI